MKMYLVAIILFVSLFGIVSAQNTYQFSAQKKMIPPDLGKVFLGIPLDQFAKQIDLKNASVDSRFDFLKIDIPFEKGNVSGLVVKVSGFASDEKSSFIFEETVKRKDEFGKEYEDTVERIRIGKLPASAFVYSMDITFKPDFDLKSSVLKTYGKNGEVRKPDDEYHFFDIQWTTKTGDGLNLLIRSFHEGKARRLQLNGRIKGTEWEVDED